MSLTVDLHKDLVEVPAPVGMAAHSRYSLAPDIGCEHRTEAIPPEPHRLMADVDPSLEQQVFDIAQRKRKPHIHHYDKAEHLRR